MDTLVGDCKYKICEVDEATLRGLLNTDGFVMGMCSYPDKTIYVNQSLDDIQKAKTLRHELCHAFLFEFGFIMINKFSQEGICEFIAQYGGKIDSIVREYFNV